MKIFPSIAAVGLALTVASQAYAVMPPDTLVNGTNSTFRSGTIGGNTGGGTASPQLGGSGGGGGGTTIGGACDSSPENATAILALVSGAGLIIGRKISRSRSSRLLSAAAI